MSTLLGRIEDFANTQHDVVAVWQLQQQGWQEGQIKAGLRGLRRVYRGVCALGDLTELGWHMAAALSGGPGAVVSHVSALGVIELRPMKAGDIHVTLPKRGGTTTRDGVIYHRPRTAPEVWSYKNVPVVSPTQGLKDAGLKPHELYRALDIAERRGIPVNTGALPLKAVVRLRRAIRGLTKSEAEAKFVLLCHEHGLPLPQVNQYLNGFETDFHWPGLRLVVEVDGWEHHKEKPQFTTDRYRGLVHRVHGYEVVRISADHVYDEPDLVRSALAAVS